MKMVRLLYRLLLISPCTTAFNYLHDGHLVWHDEFNGDLLDQSNWRYDLGASVVPNQLQSNTNSLNNIKVENGNLAITARKEPNGQYTSAQINTKNKLDFKYGRFEARMKLTNIPGLQPSFILFPTNSVYGQWPLSGEMVPMNMIGSNPGSIVGSTYYGNIENGSPHTASQTYTPVSFADTTFATSFHNYAVEWEPREIRYYVDEHLFFKQNVNANSALEGWYSLGQPQPAPFDQLFYISFNLAVGGDWPGNPGAALNTPQTIYIDYIRVYQNSTVNITANPVHPIDSATSSSFTLSTTAVIAIAVIIGVIIIISFVLFYFWGHIAKKRSDSDAPLPIASASSKPLCTNTETNDKYISNIEEGNNNVNYKHENQSFTSISAAPSIPQKQADSSSSGRINNTNKETIKSRSAFAQVPQGTKYVKPQRAYQSYISKNSNDDDAANKSANNGLDKT